ncbi:MAG: YncE family protein [Bacteroidales bacterium]|jgi:YVTN family beta-propeller protein|nr:YncE family protein [Bacteroidales bacterium]
MNKNRLFHYIILFAALLLWGCSDTDNPGGEFPDNSKALLILNEGSREGNNATLARYDLQEETIIKDYFNLVNKDGLGDVANDMLQYGSKIYIAVSISGTLEVLEAATGRSLRRIEMKRVGGQSKEPRRLAAHGGKVYVTSFDDTVTRIDTLTLAFDGSVTVGMDPEGIAIKNNKIYVTNSGGLNWANGYDNSLSVIDLTSFTEEKKIVVGTNPGSLYADSQGDIYLSVTGNYADEPGAFKMIRSGSSTVETIAGIASPQKFVISNNMAYIICGAWEEPNRVVVYDCLKEEIVSDSFISDGTEIPIMNNVSVDPVTGDLFVASTDYIHPGDVYWFDKTGTLKKRLIALGINPSVVLIQN